LLQIYLITINPDNRRDAFLDAAFTMNPEDVAKPREDVTPRKWLIGEHLLDWLVVLEIIVYLQYISKLLKSKKVS
jgi:hypothetical protein